MSSSSDAIADDEAVQSIPFSRKLVDTSLWPVPLLTSSYTDKIGDYALGWWSISIVPKNYEYPFNRTAPANADVVGESMLVIHGMFRYVDLENAQADGDFKPFALVVADTADLGCSPFTEFVMAVNYDKALKAKKKNHKKTKSKYHLQSVFFF